MNVPQRRVASDEPFDLVSIERVPATAGTPEHFEVTIAGLADVERGDYRQHVFVFVPGSDVLDEVLEQLPYDVADGVRTKIEQEAQPARPRQALSTSGALYVQAATVKQALVDRNDPVPLFFRRQGRIVTVARTDDGRPTFRAVPDVASLRAIASWAADWVDSQSRAASAPPVEATKVVFRNPPEELPPVVGIVTAPVLRPDGTRLRQPGYDARTRLFFERPPGMTPVQ
jgi:hypothetical protein